MLYVLLAAILIVLASFMGNRTTSTMSKHTKGMHRILKTPFKGTFPEDTEYAIVATGCFWGAEKSFWRMPGIYSTAVGYAGAAKGKYMNTTYEQVCTGKTGHAESVLVVWHKDKLSYTDVIRMFLQCHNPTQVNGQGSDTGTQYRSAVFYHTDDQRRIAEAAIECYEKNLGNRKIATEVKSLTIDDFVYAEDYHQQYLASEGARPYCSAQPQGVNLAAAEGWLPKDLKDSFAPKLDEGFWKKHAPTYHCVLKDSHDPITSW